jgi:hypothetical protein
MDCLFVVRNSFHVGANCRAFSLMAAAQDLEQRKIKVACHGLWDAVSERA